MNNRANQPEANAQATLLIVDEVTAAPLWQRLEQSDCGSADVMLTLPGMVLLPGEPAAQVMGSEARAAEALRSQLAELGVAVRIEQGPGVQVYRVLDEQGRWQRDVMRQVDADPIAGTVLLAYAWRGGAWVGDRSADARAERHATAQRAMLDGMAELPAVVDER